MRFKNRFQRFMNHRAPANGRYKPTCYEHAANCYTHAFLIVPAIVGSALLHRLSDDCWEKITAWIYGMGLCALFIVSTVFHIVSWKKSHLRTVEHCFHMCDRMVIYFFIAASYAPWLNLRELGPLASHMRWFIWLMAAGGTIYVFLYHEKYKVVELFFYLTMGFSPALVVTSMSISRASRHGRGTGQEGNMDCSCTLRTPAGSPSSGTPRKTSWSPARFALQVQIEWHRSALFPSWDSFSVVASEFLAGRGLGAAIYGRGMHLEDRKASIPGLRKHVQIWGGFHM
ncbi:monocyte to macrophage differentiation factor isoform X1 [Mustela nigripes]|uniref:monocyte to macrophage differentiation factor isoform X1 n=1 Tax=Mustela nigripes TaxID=77151 RepID=UPI0028165584|nr:monocyte to macrophage differentiation factor isoform X1 [Mustela nigripes]